MKKNKVVNFINKIMYTKEINIDKISIKNLEEILNCDMPFFKINKFKNIIKLSEPIIYTMYDNFKKFNISLYKLIKEENVNYEIIRKELHNYPSYNENKAIEFIKEISKIKKKYIYNLQIDQINIIVTFYSNDLSFNLFHNLLRIIFVFIKTFGNNIYIYDNYNIRLLLVDFPRKLDSKYSFQQNQFQNISNKGYFNNSSGVHIKSQKELVVTRKSGINGLLIHELIHMVGLDFCFNFNNMNMANIKGWEIDWISKNNIIELNNNLGSFIECICNTNSSFFISIYNSILLCEKTNNSIKVIKYFKYFFYIEILYCFILSVKVINYFGFNTFDSFFNNTTNKKYYQNAYVFEYVVMRMFLIYNFYYFIFKKLIKNNFNKLNTYDNNIEFQKKLNKKLINSLEDPNIKKIFNIINNNLKNNNNNYMEYFLLNIN